MSQNSETVVQLLAANLGVSPQAFKVPLRNPNNFEALQAVEHCDIWGTESKLFAFCYQQVREQAGPYKIFGSREVNNVGSCIHKYADAIQKTDRALYQA